MTTKKAKQSTYERIIDNALTLFNESGERNISTNHISAHLGISPGNLYYHFRNKDEIIIQLFKRYRETLLTLLDSNMDLKDSSAIRYLSIKIFDVMWEYRFLLRDVNGLIERSPELNAAFKSFARDDINPRIHQYLDGLVKHQFIVMDQLDKEVFSLNYWMMSKYWLCFYDSVFDIKQQGLVKQRGARQIMGMLRPYVSVNERPEFDEIVAELDL